MFRRQVGFVRGGADEFERIAEVQNRHLLGTTGKSMLSASTSSPTESPM
ncbi:hypothetical protein P9209_10210 [Prescottella defluvii]|nr:hypothetical protein P9209_10210 [Prescottella defluvii]